MIAIRTKRHKRLVELLVAERKARGLAQEGLAQALRQPQTFIARIESGRRTRIDVIEFIALAEVLGLDPCTVLAEVRDVPAEWPRARKRRRGHSRASR